MNNGNNSETSRGLSRWQTRALGVIIIILGLAYIARFFLTNDPSTVDFGTFSLPAGFLAIIVGAFLFFWGRPLTGREIGLVVRDYKEAFKNGVSDREDLSYNSTVDSDVAISITKSRHAGRRRSLVFVSILVIIVSFGSFILLSFMVKRIKLEVDRATLVPMKSGVYLMIEENILGEHLRDQYRTHRYNLSRVQESFDFLGEDQAFEELIVILDSVFSPIRKVEDEGLKSGARHFWNSDSTLVSDSFDASQSQRDSYVTLNILKGKIIHQLSKNLYLDSLPRAIIYFNAALKVDPNNLSSLIGLAIIAQEITQRNFGPLNAEYLSKLNEGVQLDNRLIIQTKSGFQKARLLNNKCDLYLDLINKYIDGNLSKDFHSSAELVELFRKVDNSIIPLLSEVRTLLDSSVILEPDVYPIHVTRSQFFATYARCLSEHPKLSNDKSNSITKDIFGKNTQVSYDQALDNSVDCLRIAHILGFTQVEILDTQQDENGMSNLKASNLSELSKSPGLLKLARDICNTSGISWLSCPSYVSKY